MENSSERLPLQAHPCLPATCFFKSKALQKQSLLPLYCPALPSPLPPSLCRVSQGGHWASALTDPACPGSNSETIPTCTGVPHCCCCCCCSFSALRLREQHPSGSNAGRSLQKACRDACNRLRPWGSTGAISHAVYVGLSGGSGNTR